MLSLLEKRPWLRHLDYKFPWTINYPNFPAFQMLRDAANTVPDKAATWFYGAEIILFPANDSGSKAKITTNKMEQLFDKFELRYITRKAEKDSFKVEKEAVQIAPKENIDIILISASREYGLDDLLFGPKEQHIIKASGTPVLLVNPRGDLYALCD